MSPIRFQFSSFLALVGLVCLFSSNQVSGHARMWEPPGRSTMWKRGFHTPKNYNDNELNCGGLANQVSSDYMCGVCGDPYNGEKLNEAGGIYATGQISRVYRAGDVVTFQAEITANHKGFMEFKLCALPSENAHFNQTCLDRNTLTLADGSGTRFPIQSEDGNRMFDINVRLPADITCEFCAVQFRYHAGNNFGIDPNGRECVGCGDQEEFYGCSDITIVPQGQSLPSGSTSTGGTSSGGSTNQGGTVSDVSNPTSDTSASGGGGGPSGGGGGPSGGGGGGGGPSGGGGGPSGGGGGPCGGGGGPSGAGGGVGASGRGGAGSGGGDHMLCVAKQTMPGLLNWCYLNCQIGYCPKTHCECMVGQFVHPSTRPLGCRAVGAYAPGLDTWCFNNCARGYCPPTHCTCD